MTTLAWPTTLAAPVSRGRFRGNVAILLVGAMACALCGRLVYLAWPFDSDGAMFIYLGKCVCDGDRFCHDVIDNKFPTVGLVTALFWRAFGTNWAGYVLTQAAMAIGASLLLARTVKRRVSRDASLATLISALIYLNFTPFVFGGFQLETIQLFFATISGSAALETISGGDRRDAFLAGLAAGCAALLKPTGIAPLCALALALIYRRQRRSLGVAVAGALVPLGVGMIYMVRQDLVADLPALAQRIRAYAANTPLRWEDVIKPLAVLSFVGIGPLIRGWVFRRSRSGIFPSNLFCFAGLWFLIEFAGAVAQRRMYAYHFLPIAPPAALLFGLLPRKSEPRQLVAALLPVTAVTLLGSLMMWRSAPTDQDVALRDYVLANTQRSDAIWMDNCPRLLLDTDRRLGGRVPLTFIFGNTDDSATADSAMLINDFSIRRPLLIILPGDVERRIARDQRQTLHLLRSSVRAAAYAKAWREIDAFVHRHYTSKAKIGDQEIWRLNGR